MGVQRLRNVRAYWPTVFASIAMLALTSCAYKGEGLIEKTATGMMLQSSVGKRYRLVAAGEQSLLKGLDGHLVTVEGKRIGRSLRVANFQIPSGLHGMAVWYGVLERKGSNRLGLNDLNSGAYYLLDDGAWEVLRDQIGKPVLVEGYVDGPHRVRVLYYRALSGDDAQ